MSEINLNEKNKIIQSQKQFWNLLDANVMNNIINLFDNTNKNSSNKIIKFIEDERKKQGLDISGVRIDSYVYGLKKRDKADLYLGINKNYKDFVHISFHLSPKSLKPTDYGAIHMTKNIYTVNKRDTKRSLICVNIPDGKPKSLEFSMEKGYDTTAGETTAPIHDPALKAEMNVIITVLNRIFDEDNKEYYVGNKNNVVHVHKNTDTVLGVLNNHTPLIPMKHKGTRMISKSNNTSCFILEKRKNKKIKNKAQKTGKNRPKLVLQNNT